MHESVAKISDASIIYIICVILYNIFKRYRKAYNANGIISATTALVFLISADDERAERSTASDIEGTYADRAADFMSGEGGVI